MRLAYLQVTIEPYFYGTDERKLKIKIRANGQEFYTEQLLLPDDFESHFDQIMQIATGEIKAAIAQYSKASAADGPRMPSDQIDEIREMFRNDDGSCKLSRSEVVRIFDKIAANLKEQP